MASYSTTEMASYSSTEIASCSTTEMTPYSTQRLGTRASAGGEEEGAGAEVGEDVLAALGLERHRHEGAVRGHLPDAEAVAEVAALAGRGAAGEAGPRVGVGARLVVVLEGHHHAQVAVGLHRHRERRHGVDLPGRLDELRGASLVGAVGLAHGQRRAGVVAVVQRRRERLAGGVRDPAYV